MPTLPETPAAAQPVPAVEVRRGDVLAYDGRELLVTGARGAWYVEKRRAGRRDRHRHPRRLAAVDAVPARHRPAAPHPPGRRVVTGGTPDRMVQFFTQEDRDPGIG